MADYPLLSRLDLNLLVALDALLTERSVTRAAERLHLSQPALSASLARLRNHFNDPILARRGNAYELTPLALRLSEHTTIALDAARRVFESQATWTPHESTREFSIYGSDYGFATIGAAVSRVAARTAPGVRFRFMLHNTPIVDDAANSLRSVDAMVIPHGHLTDLPYEDLWRDRWVVVADESNTLVADGLSMEILAQCPWVVHLPLAVRVHLRRSTAADARPGARRRRRRRELPRARTLHRRHQPPRSGAGCARPRDQPTGRHPNPGAALRCDACRERPVVAPRARPGPGARMDALRLRGGAREVQSDVAAGDRYVEPIEYADASVSL